MVIESTGRPLKWSSLQVRRPRVSPKHGGRETLDRDGRLRSPARPIRYFPGSSTHSLNDADTRGLQTRLFLENGPPESLVFLFSLLLASIIQIFHRRSSSFLQLHHGSFALLLAVLL